MFCVCLCVYLWVGGSLSGCRCANASVCAVVVHLLPSDSHSVSNAGNQWMLA